MAAPSLNNMRTSGGRYPHHFIQGNSQNRGNPFRFNTFDAHGLRAYFVLVAALLLLFSSIYWLFFSPYFTIRNIRVVSNLVVPDESLRQLLAARLKDSRYGILSARNIFAFDGAQLKAQLSSALVAENIAVEKKYPSQLLITIEERPRAAVWSSRNNFYALDAQGVILGTIAQPQSSDIIIYDQSGGGVTPNTAAVRPEALAFLAFAKADARMQALGFKFALIQKPSATDITVRIDEGWDIYFDTVIPVESQLANLDLTLRHTIPPDTRKNLNYIDLRFGEKVYYKLR